MDNSGKILRESIPEGIVVLECNESLPLLKNDRVALFGRGQFEYVKSGTGSAGKVNSPYCTQIESELKKYVNLDNDVSEFYRNYIDKNPFVFDDFSHPPVRKQPILEDVFVKTAAGNNNKAIYILSRLSGECYDFRTENGDWYLTDEEKQNLCVLKKYFPDLIVLVNSGNIIDMSWVKKYNIKNVLYIWQGGQEGAAGTVLALIGEIPPSGRLADTIATDIIDYPSTRNFGNDEKNVHAEDIYVGYRYFETFARDKVLYPFGYGKGYTEFEHSVLKVDKTEDQIVVTVNVKNIGNYSGKEVVEVYYSAPKHRWGTPAKQLIAFCKTSMLAPAKSQTLRIKFDVKDMAFYDDAGKSGHAFCYVLAKGNYILYVGKNVREAKEAYSFYQVEHRVVKKCHRALQPKEKFNRLFLSAGSAAEEYAPFSDISLENSSNHINCRENSENVRCVVSAEKVITLNDVKENRHTLDEFVDTLSENELCVLVRGEGMSSVKAPIPGTACVFGGLTSSLVKKGVPLATACDGTSGLRIECEVPATAIPTGPLIASSWNPSAFYKVFDIVAEEMNKYKIDLLLGPGMNIHRNPLCGRNFEYFSEDPLITGMFAAMIAERFYNNGVYCVLKHFAVNSQECGRGSESEVLSERALREIYLKGFEIAVKSGHVKAIMTAYNRINGISASSNYDLITAVLRNEWNYNGIVMTDWWTGVDDTAKGTFSGKNFAAMIRAGGNLYMVVPDAATSDDDLKDSLKNGNLSKEALKISAKQVLEFLMQTKSYERGAIPFDETIFKVDGTAVYVSEDVKNEICPNLVESMYVAEIEYAINGDKLGQSTIRVFVDKADAIVLIVNKTEGRKATNRFRLYLKSSSKIKLEGEGITKFTIFKEKE